MLRLRFNSTWHPSLNRRELMQHIGIAHRKEGLLFQTAEASSVRIFLRHILDGKGLLAECTLRHSPSSMALAVATNAAARSIVSQARTKAAEAAANGFRPPQPATANSILAAGMAHLPPLQPTLQSSSDVLCQLLASASRAEPLWFHPSLSEQLNCCQSDNGSDRFEEEASPKTAPERTGAAAAAATPAPVRPLARSAAVLAANPGTDGASSSFLESNLLAFLQFVSVALPATNRTAATPSVVIYNTPDTNSVSRFGRLDPVAAASFAAAIASPPSPLPSFASARKRKANHLRPPPVDADEIDDTASASAASEAAARISVPVHASVSRHRTPPARHADLSALLYCQSECSSQTTQCI